MAKQIPSLLDSMLGLPLPIKKGEGILGPAPGHEEHYLRSNEEPPRGYGRRPILSTPPTDMLSRQARPLTPPPPAIGGRHHAEFSRAADPRSGVGLLGPAPGHENLFQHSAGFDGREMPRRTGRALSPPPPLGFRPLPTEHSRPLLLKHRMADYDKDYGGRGDDAEAYGEVQDPHPYERVTLNDNYGRQRQERQHFEYAHRSAVVAPAVSGSRAEDPYDHGAYDREHYSSEKYDRDAYERDRYERDPYERDTYDHENYPPVSDGGLYRVTGPDPYEISPAAATAAYHRPGYEMQNSGQISGLGLLGAAPMVPLPPPPPLLPYPQASLLGDPYMPRPMVPPVLPLLHTPQPIVQRKRGGVRSNKGRSNAAAKRSDPANGHGGTANKGRAHGGGGTENSHKSSTRKPASESSPEKKIKLGKSDEAKDSEKHDGASAKAGNKEGNESSTEAAADGNDKNSSESLLTMTIQHGESSRAFKGGSPSQKHSEKSDTKDDKTPIKCHLCNVTCANNRQFKNHMNSAMHIRCMQEVQQKSSIQVAMLLAQEGTDLSGRCLNMVSPNLGKPGSHWCRACQEYITGNVVEHRRTLIHKRAKRLNRPYCTICRWNAGSVCKYVEHMSSEEHRQRVLMSDKAEKSGQNPRATDELITVDAIGCFEGGDEDQDDEEDEDDEDHEDESEEHRAVRNKLRKSSDSAASYDGQEENENEEEAYDEHNGDGGEEEAFRSKEKFDIAGEAAGSQSGKETATGSHAKRKVNRKTVGVDDKAVEMDYNPNVVYGEEYVVAVSGLLCHLCQKFYRAEPSARLAHCRSRAHFLKLQQHLQARSTMQASGSMQTPQARGTSKEIVVKAQEQPSGEKHPESKAGEPSEGDIPENARSADGGAGVQEKDDDWPADHESADEEAYCFEGLLAQDDDFGFSIGLEKEEDLDDFPV